MPWHRLSTLPQSGSPEAAPNARKCVGMKSEGRVSITPDVSVSQSPRRNE